MRKVKSLFLVGTMILCVSLVMIFVGQAIAQQTTDAVLIKIVPELKANKVSGFCVDPETVNVKASTTVVWLSGVPDNEVQVVFKEGKTCRDVTANPSAKISGFFLDAKQCYVTSFLPYLTATTLQFVEAGTYEYDVVTEDGKMTAKGKIVVAK